MQVLGRSLHRLGIGAPSYPLVVAGVVLCAWRLANSGPLLDSSEGRHYDAGDHGRLRPGAEPRALAALVRHGAAMCRLREAPSSRGERGLAPPPPPPGGPATGPIVHPP